MSWIDDVKIGAMICEKLITAIKDIVKEYELMTGEKKHEKSESIQKHP